MILMREKESFRGRDRESLDSLYQRDREGERVRGVYISKRERM